MSVIAVGPALAIDGPLPVAPPFSLVETPGVLVDDGSDRWINGVNVYGYPSDTPDTWEPCATGTFRTKSDASEQPTPRFDSFVIYLPISCTAASMGNWEDFADRARVALEAKQSFGVEQALSQGVTLSLNPFLGDSNVTILGGGAVTPEVGLRWLEDAIGETGQMGMIHATPAVVAAWGFGAGLTGGNVQNPPDAVLRTPNGTPVISGGGYIGAEANGNAPASGQAYAFATGPVEVRLSEMQLVGDNINGTLDTSNNDVTFYAEKYALAEWDTALQSAVLIDWTP